MAKEPAEIRIEDLVEALLNVDQPLSARYLYRLSDIQPTELEKIKAIWLKVPVRRRQAVMEDLELLGEDNFILSFENFAIFGTEDSEPKVRELAVRILWEYESNNSLATLLNLLENEENREVRAATVAGLGHYIYLGELEEIPIGVFHNIEEKLLAICQGNENELIRRRALEALGFSSRPEVERLIRDAYDSGKVDWMGSALFAMGRSANQAWKSPIILMLDDDSPTIRMEAVRAAGELELKAALPQIFELLDDSDDEVRMAAIWALSQVGGPGAREALEALFEITEDDEEAEFIEAALDNLSFTEDTEIFSLMDFDEETDSDDDFFDLLGNHEDMSD